MKERSAEEWVSTTLDWADRMKRKGMKVALVVMDIGQAFPNTDRIILENRVREIGGSEKIAR